MNMPIRAEVVYALRYRVLATLLWITRPGAQQEVRHAAVGIVNDRDGNRVLVRDLYISRKLEAASTKVAVRPGNMLRQLASLGERKAGCRHIPYRCGCRHHGIRLRVRNSGGKGARIRVVVQLDRCPAFRQSGLSGFSRASHEPWSTRKGARYGHANQK